MAASDTRLERAEATGNKMLITEPRAVAARVRIGGIKGMRDSYSSFLALLSLFGTSIRPVFGT